MQANDISTDTPAVTFWYDGKGLDTPQSPNYAKGKLTEVSNASSTTEYQEFDNLGRLKKSAQITDGNTYTSKYTYNFAGALIEEEYPSGRIVKNEYESDGDIARIFGSKNATSPEKTFANTFRYTSDGKIESLRLGNGLWESAKFNNRMQPTEINLGHGVASGDLWKLTYEYGELESNGTVSATKNTGNIARQTVSFNGLTHPFVQSYKYDALQRLTEAKETKNGSQMWLQQFGYDLYGNRISTNQSVNGSTITSTPAVDANTNRFTSTSFEYDKNGNVTRDTSIASASRTFVFNADNKQRQVLDANGNPIGTYYFDGEGKRVKKVTQTETTIYVHSGGKLVAEYTNTTPPPNPTVSYTATDLLGSPRVLTDSIGTVISRRDFLPFGEEVYAYEANRTSAQKYTTTGDDGLRKRFTGYEKDNETQLDFAEARMYENRYGRFTAVDPLLASGKSGNPQTFNRFVYVNNSPLIHTDPTGLQTGMPAIDYVVTTVINSLTGVLDIAKSDRADYLVNGQSNSVDLGTASRYYAYQTGGSENFDSRTSSSGPVARSFGSVANPTSGQSIQAFNRNMDDFNQRVIQRTPLLSNLVNAQTAGMKNDKVGFVTEMGAFGIDLGNTVFTGGTGGTVRRGVTAGAEKAIALGLERYGGQMVLKDLAKETGASTFKTWATDGITRRSVKSHFGRAFNQAAERADRIHFALDGILDDLPGTIRSGRSGFIQGNFTNAELNTIFTSPNLFNKTQFYIQNRPVSPLFRPNF